MVLHGFVWFCVLSRGFTLLAWFHIVGVVSCGFTLFMWFHIVRVVLNDLCNLCDSHDVLFLQSCVVL